MKSQLLILSLFILSSFHTAHAQFQVDMSGLQVFWRIADRLAKDQDPSTEDWQQFLSHPGYQQIEKSGRRASALKKVMPTVFKPSHAQKLADLLNGPETLSKFIASHLVKVKAAQSELKAFQENLQMESMLQQARIECLRYLPVSKAIEQKKLIVYILLFEDNGFGGQSIALDLYNIKLNEAAENIGFIAHEAHHALRRHAEDYRAYPEDAPYHKLIHTLQRVMEEGVASLLDKQMYFDKLYQSYLKEQNQDRYAEIQEFIELVREMDVRLEKIDSILMGVANQKMAIEKAAKLLQAQLPWGGHTVGFYMARAIEAELGIDNLRTVANDPIAFFSLYQVAARRNKTLYRFSNTASQLLQKMQLP